MGSIVNISWKEKAPDTVLTPSKVKDYLIDVCRHQDIPARYEASAHLGSSKHQLSEYHLRRTFHIVNFLTAIFREYLTFTCLSTSLEVFYNICNVPETYLWSLDLYPRCYGFDES